MSNPMLRLNCRHDDDNRRHHVNYDKSSRQNYRHHHTKEVMKDSSEHTRSTEVSISSASSSHSSSCSINRCIESQSRGYLYGHHHMLNNKKLTTMNDFVGKNDDSSSFSSCQDRLRLCLNSSSVPSTTATIANSNNTFKKPTTGGEGGQRTATAVVYPNGTNSSLSNRARYIKTGNALWDDVEYYEFILPVPVQQNRPPRIPQQASPLSSSPKEIQILPMSEFARSAYLAASQD
jgi:hypothetical protein